MVFLRKVRRLLLGEPYQEYSICIYIGSKWKLLDDDLKKTHSTIDKTIVQGEDILFVADPFLFEKDDKLYLFFEAMPRPLGNAFIGCAVSENGEQWTYLGKVDLGEGHFSFPNVFEHDSEIYMTPENLGSHCPLFKCIEFPLVWQYETMLLDHYLADPVILKEGNRYFLFGAPNMATLELFTSDTIIGPYKAHPQNPIIKDQLNVARPAGRIFYEDGKYYRVFQDCSRTYGSSVGYAEIVELSEDRYEERILSYSHLALNGRKGIHHLDVLSSKSNGSICVIDAWKLKYSR